MLKRDARILIVDDSRMVRLAMAETFHALGYLNVLEAADGLEAINVHATEHPDLILLDIVMPNMRGDQALAQIRASDKTTPIIMLSSVAKQSEIDACTVHGITEYMLKPILSAEGVALIGEVLERL